MRKDTLFEQIVTDATHLKNIISDPKASADLKEKMLPFFIDQATFLFTDKLLDAGWQSPSEDDAKAIHAIGQTLSYVDAYGTISMVLKLFKDNSNLEYKFKNDVLAKCYARAIHARFTVKPLETVEERFQSYCKQSKRKPPFIKELMLDGYIFAAQQLIKHDVTATIEFLDRHVVKNTMATINLTVDMNQANQMLYAEAIGEYCKTNPDAVERVHALYASQALSKKYTVDALINIGKNTPAEFALPIYTAIHNLFQFTNEPFWDTPSLNDAILQASLDLAMTASSLHPQEAFLTGLETTEYFGFLNRSWKTKDRGHIEQTARALFEICTDMIVTQPASEDAKAFIDSIPMPHHPMAQEALRTISAKLSGPATTTSIYDFKPR